MRKIQLLIVVFTITLAVSFTALALIGLVYLTDYTSPITTTGIRIPNWSGVAVQGLARWPELAGLIVGQLIIISVLLSLRRRKSGSADESLVTAPPPQRTDQRQAPTKRSRL